MVFIGFGFCVVVGCLRWVFCLEGCLGWSCLELPRCRFCCFRLALGFVGLVWFWWVWGLLLCLFGWVFV